MTTKARKFFRRREPKKQRRANFSKTRSARRRRFRQKIIEIGAILVIIRPFEVFGRFCSLCCTVLTETGKKKRHFSANSADRPRIYIETLYKSNVPRDVCLNSSKSGG